MQAEPHGAAQVDNILRIEDRLLVWTNFMCSSSVRHSQILDTYTILMPSPYLQVRHSWEMADREKEYPDKVEWTNGLSLNTFLHYFSFDSPKECFRISRLGSGPQ